MLSRKEDALFKLQLEFKKEKQELIDQYQGKSKNSEFEDEIKALLMPFSKTSIPNDKDILETAKLMVEHVQSLSEKLLQYEEKISALQNASNELELKMNDYEIENRKLVEEKNGMEMENLKLKREMEGIKVEKDQFQSSASSKQLEESRINDLSSQVHSQQDQIQSLEQQNEILESQIATMKIEPQTIQDLTNKYPSITSKFLSQADKKYEKMLKFHQDEYLRQLDQERQHTEKTCQVLKQECKSAYDNAMSQLLAAFKEKESQVLTKLQTKYKSRINELGNQIQKLNDQELNLNVKCL